MASTATNPCVELALIDDPSFSSSTGGAGVFFKWLGWGALYLAAAIVALAACAVLFRAAAGALASRQRRAAAASRRRLQRRMMKAMWHAPYQRLLAAGFVRNPCVVCRTDFEAPAGETKCSVLPGCVHVFHSACIAKWLQHHTTCPVCNATVARQQRGV